MTVLSGRSSYIVKLLCCVVSHSEKNPQKTNAWNFSSTLSYYLIRTNTFPGHVIAFLVTTVCATFLRTVNAIKRFSTIYIHKYEFKKTHIFLNSYFIFLSLPGIGNANYPLTHIKPPA